jgi:RNA polymerase sigma factor (sigma-70 family)
MDDLQLWMRLKNGHHNALKEIYDLHARSLENYAKKFTPDTGLIEDTIHDIFVQIWQKKETLSDTDSIIKYMCVTLRRELIRRIEKSHKTSGLDYVENKDTDFSLTIEDMMIQDETFESNKIKLQQSMELLSSRQREAVYLKYYEEMSYEEICDIMDINYQSVRNLISKGIIELRKYIAILVALSFSIIFV